MTQTKILPILNQIRLFQDQRTAILEEIAKGASLRHLGANERLFDKGDPADHIYCIIDGRVKLSFLSDQGHEKVVEIAATGDTFGEAAVFLEKPYPVYADALVPSTLIAIHGKSLMRMMATNHEVASRMIATLSQRLHRMIHEMESFCILNARERVVGYLLHLIETQAPNQPQPKVELPATKSTIASMLNLSPETFSRVLHGLKREGAIEIENRRIAITDMQALRSRVPC